MLSARTCILRVYWVSPKHMHSCKHRKMVTSQLFATNWEDNTLIFFLSELAKLQKFFVWCIESLTAPSCFVSNEKWKQYSLLSCRQAWTMSIIATYEYSQTLVTTQTAHSCPHLTVIVGNRVVQPEWQAFGLPQWFCVSPPAPDVLLLSSAHWCSHVAFYCCTKTKSLETICWHAQKNRLTHPFDSTIIAITMCHMVA